MRNVVWAVPGMAHFGEQVAKILGWELVVAGPVGDVDTVYIMGLYDPPYYHRTLESTKRAKRRIIHFCGTDVQLLRYPHLLPEAVYLCESEDLEKELREKGISARVLMLPTKHHFEVTPLPEEPTVSVYLGSDPDKYGAPTLMALMDAMPEVKFQTYYLGSFGPEEMKDLCRDTTVYLRLTLHDGSAQSAREFMEGGRRAVITANLPHASVVPPQDLVLIMSKLRRALSFKEPDQEAAEFYQELNSEERYLSELREAGVL